VFTTSSSSRFKFSVVGGVLTRVEFYDGDRLKKTLSIGAGGALAKPQEDGDAPESEDGTKTFKLNADGTVTVTETKVDGTVEIKVFSDPDGDSFFTRVQTRGAGADDLIADDKGGRLRGGLGRDSITGGKGDDDLAGDDGNDTLDGGRGDDRLVGGAGDDSLDGGDGNDRLADGDGLDRLLGGKGNDIFMLATNAGSADTILDFKGGAITSGHYIFNANTKELFYDANGGTHDDAFVVATLVGVTTLADQDYVLIA